MASPPAISAPVGSASPSADIVVASRDVLRTHAKTFRLASLVLPAYARDDAAVVYAVCRLIDDTVDEASDADEAARACAGLRAELEGSRPSRPLIAAYDSVREVRGIPRQPALDLLDGCVSDLGEVRFADDRALIRYGYHVAGTVGWMMCGVIGARHPEALAHAIDLGVGMQITNICRDVLEDAKNGRVYLPADRLRAAGVTQHELVAGNADPAAVATVVEDLLALADRYYTSGDHGLRYIPGRSRAAIAAASRMYRAIGDELRRQNYDALRGRAWVPPHRKAWWLCAGIARAMVAPWRLRQDHDPSLHRPLDGLVPPS